MIIQKEDILREERKKKGSPPLRFSVETGGRRRFLRDICRGEKRGNEFGGHWNGFGCNAVDTVVDHSLNKQNLC